MIRQYQMVSPDTYLQPYTYKSTNSAGSICLYTYICVVEEEEEEDICN